ncbi:protease complex subunit PrcB family protein [Alkaliphilus sp. MSJ-5]|uniref:Protease complex subunit PrcB family protein n=2 Tax=Alkaliphilus flagellatus TaxID=2841507 RepID=A0ABS6G0Y3_9FIRM|nr:protease complex subunit PrcB family protein [Alkaliphilus flagellatus]
MPKLPKVNWKLLITMILIIVVATALVKFIPKLISKGDNGVGYMVLDKEQIPEKIHEILPRYKMLERALAAKVDDQIYVIVTRGEKLTAGYDVDIERIELVKEENDTRLVVHAVFKDPNPDDLVTQSMTHPYVVAKTELEELPTKIDLEIKQKE